VAGASTFLGEGHFPISAYSEFIPPPHEGCKPYTPRLVQALDDSDPWGWPVSEFEEEMQLRPGLHALTNHMIYTLAELAQGRPVRGLSRRKLHQNPAWPDELAEKSPGLTHERFVTLAPRALSRTQDDKGRIRWTLFGASEQGPARGFWRSFWITPRKQAPSNQGEAFIRQLLHSVYGESLDSLTDLRRAGFRILPLSDDLSYPFSGEEPLPAWTTPYLWAKGQTARSVRYLLTFRPFSALPAAIRQAYFAGQLHLLPCPGSLILWGVPGMLRLREELPLAVQIPLLHILMRHEGLGCLRIPQSGWMHEPHPDHPLPDDPHLKVHNTYQRTHRWNRMHRHEDPLEVLASEDKLAHVLFSTAENDMGLYGKPMARNVEIWTDDYHLLLNGPHASPEEIRAAAHRVANGGLFGYRFQFPAMRVGRHELYWHRPLVSYFNRAADAPAVLTEAPLGYFTAYLADRPDLAHPVELWPRMQRRAPFLDALQIFHAPRDHNCHQTMLNSHLVLDTWKLGGERSLSPSFAQHLLVGNGTHTLDHWLASLPIRADDTERGHRLADELTRCLASPGSESKTASSLTYRQTAKRSFEVNYWKTIAHLAEGDYINKSNADCIRDEPTQDRLSHLHRDLDALGDYILKYYHRVVARAGLEGKALVGDLPFQWQTDFDFSWMGGWLKNQAQEAHERNLMVVIPGKDRRRAVIMADHYDTAYMVDCYDPEYGGTGARLAAAGADDNHSATAALMLGAPIFLEMSKKGQLGCDVWLIHLTGEEFPSDCLGARHLSQLLVEGRLQLRVAEGRWRDLSRVRIQGLYVLDMVAHNNDREPNVFQIAPGTGRQSLWLAEQAHLATEAWNAGTQRWNRRPGRQGPGRRSPKGSQIPEPAAHPVLRGEVRLPANPRSTLYNTDGQVFSDAGIPAVLFMENYDINRAGYHDTHDNMANIDLDYGAAVTAIAIESVARAATAKPPR
jgi:hypothetical protein